jgi:hypothetical protein
MTAPLEDAERLPCGCIVGTIGDAFAIRPCRSGCRYYLFVLAEAARQGKPISTAVEG